MDDIRRKGVNKGVIKKEVGQVDIKGCELGYLITQALLVQGYELIVNPIVNDGLQPIGEQIVIYRVEEVELPTENPRRY